MHLYPLGSGLSAALLLSSTVLMSAVPAAAQNSLRPRLTVEQCQPLTRANFAMCCIAVNRQSILAPEQLAQCPPLTTSVISSALSGRGDGRSGGGNGGGSSGGSGGSSGGAGGGGGGGG
jgi:uncharacterized membrane protein YgcG